jgi:anionic cell wall polymer biosynthesis LytR-Cps2A-Psr (LCP) family protein
VATKLAAGAIGIDGEDMQTHMIPGKSGTKDGLSYWFPDEDGIEELLNSIYKVEPEQEKQGDVTEN